MSRRRPSSPHGTHVRPAFSLVETVVAVVVLGVAVPPVLWSLSAGQARRANAGLAATATWLATEKLEDIIADRHSTTRGYNYVIASNYGAETAVTGFPRFARNVAISETAANLTSSGTGYKTVTVNVTYSDASNATRTLQLRTVVTSYTP